MLRNALVIALIALIVSACCSSREATREVSSLRIQDSRDSVKVEKVVVAVHDTMMETKTITITKNVDGDTLRLTKITDRTRASAMSDVRSKKEDVRVRVDTVYVERRDSSYVKNTNGTNGTNSRDSPVVSGLKWVFWIILGLIVLIVVIKFLK